MPCPPPGDLPNPGIEPWSPSLQDDSLPSKPKKWKPKLERSGKEAIICSHGSFNKCPYLNVFVCECVCMLCLFQTPQTVAHQAPLSMEFLRQEHWSGCPFLLLLLLTKSLQSYPTLCDPTDGSPPDSPVPGILQTRTLEWVANAFSSAGK